MNLTNCLNNTNKEDTMDLIEAWLKTNTPTKCPDCYYTPDKLSEYEKAKQIKGRKSKARKVLDSKAFEKESKILCSIQ